MKNAYQIQGILSVAAILCLVIGWLNLFSPEVNSFFYNKLLYVLFGASFFVQAPLLSNKKFTYPMYIAGILCVIGAFIPLENQFSAIKTIGLITGVVISLFNRPRFVKNN